LLKQNAEKDERPTGSTSSQNLDLGFPEDDDEPHRDGEIQLFS